MKKIKKLFILVLIIYATFTVINQQKTINKYNQEIEDIFVETARREKLDMYYPNERVYIDTGM